MKMAVELWSGPYGHLTCPLVLPPDLMILRSVFCNARHSMNWVAGLTKSNVQDYINVLKLNHPRVTVTHPIEMCTDHVDKLRN